LSPVIAYLVQTVVTLLAVALVAGLILYGARRIGIGRPSGPLELVGHLPLDGRRAIYLVRVAERVFIVGASESGLRKLGELPAEALPAGAPVAPGFPGALARAMRRSVRPQGGERKRDSAVEPGTREGQP
jgi:flagellar protein FliO/FliZ